MTPAYKEALKTKGESTYKHYFPKEKSLLESMLVIFMWIISMMYEQIEWKVLLLWVFAFILMSRVWSIFFGAITLFVAVGVYIGTPYEMYYTMVFFFLMFTALFTLISPSNSSNNYNNIEGNDYSDVIDIAIDVGGGDC